MERLPGIGSTLGIPDPSDTPSAAVEGLNDAPPDVVRRLIVPGPPMPMPRAKVRIIKPKSKAPFPQFYTPDEATTRQEEIRLLWRGRRLPPLEDGPIGVHTEFVWRHPPSHYGAGGALLSAHVGTVPGQSYGDVDNLIKLWADALQAQDMGGLIAYRNDAQLARFTAEKRWAIDGEDDHTLIALWPI